MANVVVDDIENIFFNEQWLTFILGLFFFLPFLVGMILPFLKRSDRFPTTSYQLGFCFNILGFNLYIIGVIVLVQILHKQPSFLINYLPLTPSNAMKTTNSTHGN
ncbi:hypothetical protein KC19_11G107500 [Ceratodon purpureus]|uniref:Uncharacterized protein n=1 Tax=Ceratodon purpureus TaxID=3225 RepID=A0A8T0GD64_CERPU|nr:hypothetical protein KC19_11G107500 [Ceratodon purpureus]